MGRLKKRVAENESHAKLPCFQRIAQDPIAKPDAGDYRLGAAADLAE